MDSDEEDLAGHDIRFCPYCFLMSFNMKEIKGGWVFCEYCGVDVEAKELVKQ